MNRKEYIKGKMAQGDKLTHCLRCKVKLGKPNKEKIAKCPKCEHEYWVG